MKVLESLWDMVGAHPNYHQAREMAHPEQIKRQSKYVTTCATRLYPSYNTTLIKMKFH